MMPVALRLPNRKPVANELEILKSDAASGVLGVLNDLFRDNMIFMTAEVGLPMPYSFQDTLGGFRSFLLEALPGTLELTTDLLDFLAAAGVAVGVNQNVDDSHIDPDKVVDLDGRVFGHVNGAVEVELSVTVDEVDLTFEPVKASLLVLSEDVGDHQSTSIYGKNADAVAVLERDDTVIVDHRSLGAKDRADSLVSGECISSFPNGSNSHLGRDAEFVAEFAVTEFLDGRAAEHPGIKTSLRRERCRRVELPHGIQQRCRLLGSRQQFELERQLHDCSIGSLLLPSKAGLTNLEAIRSSVA